MPLKFLLSRKQYSAPKERVHARNVRMYRYLKENTFISICRTLRCWNRSQQFGGKFQTTYRTPKSSMQSTELSLSILKNFASAFNIIRSFGKRSIFVLEALQIGRIIGVDRRLDGRRVLVGQPKLFGLEGVAFVWIPSTKISTSYEFDNHGVRTDDRVVGSVFMS